MTTRLISLEEQPDSTTRLNTVMWAASSCQPSAGCMRNEGDFQLVREPLLVAIDMGEITLL
jgi:hypothetical protein